MHEMFPPVSTYIAFVALLFSGASRSAAIPAATTANDWTTQLWDVIVVGAGPAGIIVADRMSEVGKNTLLLEGGGPSYGITGGTQRPAWLAGTNLSRVDVPGLYSSIFSDQGGMTCSGVVNAFGGCTVGGSSAINAGLFFQPPSSDFDKYFPAGWKYADVKASIARLNFRQPSTTVPSVDGKYYLQEGYNAAKQWLVTGAGYTETDINAQADKKFKVFGHPVYDYSNGQRGGPTTNYLQTALKRANFCLQSGVRVKSITRTAKTSGSTIATPSCPAAQGTKYTDANGFTYSIHCGADNSVGSYAGRAVSTGGFSACFSICDADTANKCIGFSYVGGNSGTCYLKNAEGSYPANSAVTSCFRVAGSSSSSISSATGVIAKVNGIDTAINLATGGRVIVSGGALQSPQILMYSGIGDPAVLTTLKKGGILTSGMTPSNWINNTAVGAGLFDNPNTFIELQSQAVPSYVYNYSNVNAADTSNYLSNRSGPYAFAGQTSAFWSSLTHADGSVVGFQGTIGTSGYADYTNGHTITMNIYGTSGLKSSGKVVLDSNFIPGPSGDVYYSNTQDAQDIATFIRGIFDALPASSFTPLNIPQTASTADILQYITTPSNYARGQVNHWSSSCRLGSCVDVNTTVIGTGNIHVVDGSIVAPLTVNPQMGIMIAAERASELILKL
ncbi:hypothetical protein LTR66_001049 [Elasticomyces elasticus]|nr:hypothetical protein LTR66_001049 [Elasticomyces elasticus]